MEFGTMEFETRGVWNLWSLEPVEFGFHRVWTLWSLEPVKFGTRGVLNPWRFLWCVGCFFLFTIWVYLINRNRKISFEEQRSWSSAGRHVCLFLYFRMKISNILCGGGGRGCCSLLHSLLA